MRRTTIIVIGLFLVVAIGGATAWRQWPARVDVVAAQRGEAVEAVYATGIVEPTVQMPVSPRAGGRLVSLEVDEGAAVRRGQVLARVEGRDLDLTVQELAARERLARTQHERTQALVAEKFLSPAELDRTRTELEAAQAASQRAQAQRDYALLVAPADGVVLRRDGERGQFIPAGQAVYTLACCAPLRVAAEVDEEDIARVTIGMPVVLRGDALPGRLFDGEVAEITPKGDPVARSYRVRIRFKDAKVADALGTPPSEASLRVGMTMDANLVIARHAGALLVPSRALRGSQVWVLAAGRVAPRAVQLGVKGTERTQVTGGLQPGDEVVVSATDMLRNGQRARAVAPAASVPGQAP